MRQTKSPHCTNWPNNWVIYLNFICRQTNKPVLKSSSNSEGSLFASLRALCLSQWGTFSRQALKVLKNLKKHWYLVSVSIGIFPSTRPIPILVSLSGPQRYRYRYWYRYLDLTDTDTDTSIVIWTSAIPIPILVSFLKNHRYQYRYLVSEAKVSVTDTDSIAHLWSLLSFG